MLFCAPIATVIPSYDKEIDNPKSPSSVASPKIFPFGLLSDAIWTQLPDDLWYICTKPLSPAPLFGVAIPITSPFPDTETQYPNSSSIFGDECIISSFEPFFNKFQELLLYS